MSDFNLLFKRYNSVSNLTSELNDSVITLKRKAMSEENKKLHEPVAQVSDLEVAKANEVMIEILSLLARFYKNQDTANELYELMDNNFFQNQILKNTEFKDDILVVLGKVKSGKKITYDDLAIIDKFVSILDNEAAFLFKKLRTSRE